jgi:DtxR family Mn-dependent transcriptional regulator
MNFSTSEENYIKSIYHLQLAHQKVSTSMLSVLVNTKASSVSDMLKKLHQKEIVHYEPYKSFMLTEAGNKIALNIIRKHRLWEYFLVNTLGFEWDEVHDIAEELEHIKSTHLIDRLDSFLHFPSFDPHGDPIPNSKGKITELRRMNLIEIPLKKTAVVHYIKDQSNTMLDLLKHYRIEIGSTIIINKKFDFDGSVEICIEQDKKVLLSNLVAKNIYCTL